MNSFIEWISDEIKFKFQPQGNIEMKKKEVISYNI